MLLQTNSSDHGEAVRAKLLESRHGDFPGSPVADSILPIQGARGAGSAPGWGTKFPHATVHPPPKKKIESGHEVSTGWQLG